MQCGLTSLSLLIRRCAVFSPKESAEHFNRMLSERAQEIQELRKQLADKQQELTKAEKKSSSTTQESYLETAELRTLLAEKDSLIDVRSLRDNSLFCCW